MLFWENLSWRFSVVLLRVNVDGRTEEHIDVQLFELITSRLCKA